MSEKEKKWNAVTVENRSWSLSFEYAVEQKHNISFLNLNKARRSFQLVINLFLFAGRAAQFFFPSIFPLCRHSVYTQFTLRLNSIKCWNKSEEKITKFSPLRI